MATIKKALNYVHNAGGNATRSSMMQDYAPVGHLMFERAVDEGYVIMDRTDKSLRLTAAGQSKRRELNSK